MCYYFLYKLFTVPESCREVFLPVFQLTRLPPKVDKRPTYLANLTSKLKNLIRKKFWTYFWPSFLGPSDPTKMTTWAKTINLEKWSFCTSFDFILNWNGGQRSLFLFDLINFNRISKLSNFQKWVLDQKHRRYGLRYQQDWKG